MFLQLKIFCARLFGNILYFYVPTDSSCHGHHELQIWPGGLQQFTEAHLNHHSVDHRGDVTSHQICGGAEGPGNQPQQLQCPNTVLHLCGWSLLLLSCLWIFAGNMDERQKRNKCALKSLSFYCLLSEFCA